MKQQHLEFLVGARCATSQRSLAIDGPLSSGGSTRNLSMLVSKTKGLANNLHWLLNWIYKWVDYLSLSLSLASRSHITTVCLTCPTGWHSPYIIIPGYILIIVLKHEIIQIQQQLATNNRSDPNSRVFAIKSIFQDIYLLAGRWGQERYGCYSRLLTEQVNRINV